MSEGPFGGRMTVPRGWTVQTLDSIKSPDPNSCRAGPFGSNISQRYFVDEGVPVIRGNNLTLDLRPFVAEGFVFVSEQRARENYKACLVSAGDLVFTCWGSIGQVGRIPEASPFEEYVISNKQLKLRVDANVADSRFVYYYLASPEGVAYLRSRAIGSAVPGINLGILKSITVALPARSIQERIADVLSTYDDLIAANERRMALLEKSVHLLYREWFQRLRFPGHEWTPVRDGVPEGWTRTTLGDYAPLSYGKALPDKERQPGDVPVFGSSGIVGRHASRLVDGPGIIVGRKGNVGAVHWCSTDFFPIDTTFFVEPARVTHFLRRVLSTLQFTNSDSAVPGLNRGAAHAQQLIVPHDSVLAVFEERASETQRLTDVLLRSNAKLREARDYFLPRLLSGQLTV